MKKRVFAALLVGLLCILSACGSQKAEESAERPVDTLEVERNMEASEIENSIKTTETEIAEMNLTEQKTAREISEDSGILIVYFSRWGNTKYPDDVAVFDSLDGREEITFSLAE